MDNRPTLEAQIRARKEIDETTDEEIMAYFAPARKPDLWLFSHCHFVWRIIHWCWFDIHTGEDGLWNYIQRRMR